MALYSLGKNAAIAQRLTPVAPTAPPAVLGVPATPPAVAEEVAKTANTKIVRTKEDLQAALAPWIPGDLLAFYGALLAAWKPLQADFWFMLWLVVGLSFALVLLGAFAGSAFIDAKTKAAKQKLRKTLVFRIVVGMVAAFIATFAVPTSRWYEFAWFTANQTSVITTVGLGTTLLLLVLAGLQKRGYTAE